MLCVVSLGVLPMLLCLTSISILSHDTNGDSDGDDAETDGETVDRMGARVGMDMEYMTV